jgi:hypothetical protein
MFIKVDKKAIIIQPQSIVNVSGVVAESRFVFVQTAFLATWTIDHNLGKLYPNITVVDESSSLIICDISPLDANTLRLIFNYPTMGTAYLN